jgi:acylphosphatase
MHSKQAEGRYYSMRTRNPSHRTLRIAVSIACILVGVAAFSERLEAQKSQTAVSGTVTGDVQKVGFRALIQKQAIEYNLAGSTKNNSDGSVQFTLQGDGDRIQEALKTIRKGPKKASNVNVSTSPAPVDQSLKTFKIFDWTSQTRVILTPYTLVFSLRNPDTIINKKKDIKAVWLKICEVAVQGSADQGKCDKDKDDDEE